MGVFAEWEEKSTKLLRYEVYLIHTTLQNVAVVLSAGQLNVLRHTILVKLIFVPGHGYVGQY